MLGFKDYVLIAKQLEEAEADDGKVWDAIKTKLGQQGADKLKAIVDKKGGLKTKKPGQPNLPKQPGPKVQLTPQEKRDADLALRKLKPGSRQGIDPADAVASALAEALEFKITFCARNSDVEKKTTLKGRDARDVREKFSKNFHGMKLLTIAPLPKKRIREETEASEYVIRMTKSHNYPRAGKKEALANARESYYAGGEYNWTAGSTSAKRLSKGEADRLAKRIRAEDFNVYPNGGMGKANDEDPHTVEVVKV